MAHYATVEADIRCPSCSAALPGCLIGFQWGYCDVPYGSSWATYQIGDPILWRLDRNGAIAEWTVFRGGSDQNIGAPAYADVDVCQAELFGISCPHCSHGFAQVIVVIRGGIIRAVRTVKDTVFAGEVSLVGPDGNSTPMPEWDDAQIAIVDCGDEVRLVAAS